MKKRAWLAWIVASGVGVCSAQESGRLAPAEDPALDAAADSNPWEISGGLVYRNYLYQHDALQQRAPADSDLGEEWEKGDTSGSGYGIQARIGRGDGGLNLLFLSADLDFKYAPPGGRHEIETTAQDLTVTWEQIRGRNGDAEWGSTLGFRHLGTQKSVHVTEGNRQFEGDADATWLLLVGGYHGQWRPYGTPTFGFHGRIDFLLGEVSGTARSGEDESWSDGVVSETYDEEHSLGYGAHASFGMDIAITKRLILAVDYSREWLYSFDATDTGIVVFPDNSDALFIENQHTVTGSLKYRF